MRTTMRIVIALLLLVLTVANGRAQTQIALDSTTLGVLTADLPQANYSFNGTANTSVTIDVLSITPNLYPQVIVLDPNGALVFLDDNTDQRDNVTTSLTLSATGTYSILIAGSNPSGGEFILSLTSSAGASCEVYMSAVIAEVDRQCQNTARNELCYGNRDIQAQYASAGNVAFNQPGDIIPVTDLQSLQLSQLNEAADTWGVALMQLQANLPNTLPGQNVTVLLFGDVAITPDQQVAAGAPLQAFYFTTGIGDSACEDVPDDGIAIRTPSGVGAIQLTVNGVELQIASTVYITQSADQTLDFTTVEGVVVVEALGGVQVATENRRVRVPINADLRPSGEPQAPEEIDPAQLPIPVREVTPPPPTATPTTAATSIPNPVVRATATPAVTATPGIDLPATGPCVLTTFEPVNVNVRSGPGEDFGVISFIEPTRSYRVTGRNRASTWYQISNGWVAGFVTRRGGDCTTLPITYTPPTATPAITPTPTINPDWRIAGDDERQVTINYVRNGQQHYLVGDLSYPQGDRADTVTWFADSSAPSGAELVITIYCEGEPSQIQNTVVRLPDGSSRTCTPLQSPYQFVTSDPAYLEGGNVRISILDTAPFGSYVTWVVDFAVRRVGR